MSMRLFCGDPLCKKPVEAKLDGDPPWPVRCPSCGVLLYPTDILESSRPDDLAPQRAELMREDGAKRVGVQSNALTTAAASTQDKELAAVDELLSMVDLGDEQPAEPARQMPWAIVGGIIVVVAAVVIFLLAR